MGTRDASEKEATSRLALLAVPCCMNYVSVEAEHPETPLSASRAFVGGASTQILQQLSEASLLYFKTIPVGALCFICFGVESQMTSSKLGV